MDNTVLARCRDRPGPFAEGVGVDEEGVAPPASRPPPVKPLPSEMRVEALERPVRTVSSDVRVKDSVLFCESCDDGRDVTANAGGGVRVRMGVGMMGGDSETGLTSNVAFGDDIERPFGFLDGPGEGDGDAAGGEGRVSKGCV